MSGALESTAGRAVWFVDGVPRKTIAAAYVPACPMCVLLSHSVSSARGPLGVPDEKTAFPKFFAIDYIRIYQPAVPVLAKGMAELEAVVAKLESAELPAVPVPESVAEEP